MDQLDPQEYQEYLEIFGTEAAEHLASLDDLLLEAERLAGGGQDAPAELVNGIFRAMHTLKGMAGMMDFGATMRLAHLMEHFFDEVRQGKRRLSVPALAVVFEGVDALKALKCAIQAQGNEAGCDVQRVRQALEALAEAPPTPEPAGAAPATPGTTDWLARLDATSQTFALMAQVAGAQLYEIRVRAARDCPAGPAAWLDELQALGRVLGCWNSAGEAIEMPSAALAEVLFLTEAEHRSVLEVSGVPPENLQLVPLASDEVAPAAETPRADVAAPVERPAASERATTIRVETTRLDRLMELVGELVIHQTRLAQLYGRVGEVLEAEHAELQLGLDEAMQSLAWVSGELRKSSMRVRMVAVGALFNRYPRIVRDLARECGKRVRLEVLGAKTELDKTVVEQIGDPLIHLLRNAVDHGLEAPEDRLAAGKPAEGVITLAAAQQGHHILITIADDGRGIDGERVLAKARERGLLGENEQLSEQEMLGLIFRPGFSTAQAVTNLSGRGVGMDVVLSNIQRLGGSVQVSSEPGRGTRFLIKLPLTLAITKALLVSSGEDTYAIPLASVEETLRLRPEEMRSMQGRTMIQVRGAVLPLLRLSELFAQPTPAPDGQPLPTVVVHDGEKRLALVVEGLIGQQDVVVKSLGDFLGHPPGIGGATILGDGRVALILDIPTLSERPPVAAR